MNGWTDNKYPVEDEIDQDYQREMANIEQMEFEIAMFEHLQENNGRPCGNNECDFCDTLADKAMDAIKEMEADEYNQRFPIAQNSVVDYSDIPF